MRTEELWQCPSCGAIDELGPRSLIHWVRITDPDDLDEKLRTALRDSYRVGAG